MPEKDNLSFETLKLSAVNTLKKGLAIGGSVLALAGGTLAREAVFNPAEATAGVECTTTETTTTDGTTTTTTETTHCADDGGDSSGTTADQPSGPTDTPSNPGHQQPNDNQGGNHKHNHGKPDHNQTVHGPKDDKTDFQKNFPGYNMEDSPFTDGNGCFVTSAASSLRRETGNAHITPKKIYFPALQQMWSPSAGVKGGLLFDALPSISSHFDVKVYKTNFQGAVKAIKNDDEVMMLAAPGHFTSQGHYMAAWKLAGGNRLVIDDPNGKGKHGDSERPGGWSGSELKRAGIIGYRVLHLRGN